ncbi:Vps54-like protein-domain-containing protein [Talaromyces proteolyticus]|uniref:Vacuolar protein sorting-associated protein 54 n=1 Tax=Talaromyces proteolyticus TaxID=1131652 RepID=A0AAD4L1H3_9EURO|nr:Vps54-like protein-domain-containing protein [Talaromyces proteolyticus]KAH8703906.1 Vps54-like protein-domain-containing protein [Talaromyces proteolyticus]
MKPSALSCIFNIENAPTRTGQVHTVSSKVVQLLNHDRARTPYQFPSPSARNPTHRCAIMATPSGGKSPAGSPSPRAEDPFPGHDWWSRSPRPPATRVSNASATNPSSISVSLDNASHSRRSRGTVAESGQNAISTLLQPPILRAAIHSTSQKPPTSRDIPPVTLTTILDVEPSAFEDYLSEVGSLFDALQRTKLESEDGGAPVSRQDISAAKDDELAPCGRRKTSASKRSQLAPAPLSMIPSVYFDENFRLENPRTFDVVSEHAEVVKQPLSTIGDRGNGANGTAANGNQLPARKTLTTNAILQEKLLWYMDTVEIHLIFSISQLSASFFAAIGSLRELQIEAADSVVKIQKLRDDLADLNKNMVVPGFEISSMKRRRDNLRKLGEATEQLRCVLSGASHCEELVNSGQLETAIKHISYVEQLASETLDPKIGGELHWLLPNPSIRLTDLRRLHVLGGSLRGIDQLRLRIGKGYEARLLNVLLCDLRRHVSGVPPRDTLARWTDTAKRVQGVTDVSSSTPASMRTAKKLREELIPVLQGLGQSQYLAAASTTFREAVIGEMKSLIRQHLPSSTDDDNESVASASSGRRPTLQEKSNILSRNLRALSPEDAEVFFVKVYCGIGEALRRLRVQVKVLLDITSGMKNTPSNVLTPVQSPGSMGNPAIRSPSLSTGCNLQEEMTLALDMSNLLEQAVDKAQSEVTKVLRVRTEQTVRLGLTDFLRYFTLNRLFVNECEAVSGYSGAALKGVVNNQIHDFIPRLHEVEKQKLVQRMESEKWERIDFKPQDALILAHIVQSMNSDPPAWLGYTDASTVSLEAGERNLQTNLTPAEPTNAAKQDKKALALAVIEEEKFILVDSAVFALRGIEQYTVLLASVPGMANDISTILLDYLKLYNSRAQQLILGAGAKITAGLTNINTKHLALASQSLSFFIALIPYVRECVRRRPSITGSSMAEYDRLKRLLQDHQSAIHDKLVDIMSFRATVCTREMEKVKWDDEDEVQRNVSPHMETLTKEALTLHRVLNKYLPALNVRMIVGRVFVSYKEQWSKAFESAAIRTEAGQARLLRDAELLGAKLGKIDGGEELGAHLINIVKAKQVASRSKTSTSAPSGEDIPA